MTQPSLPLETPAPDPVFWNGKLSDLLAVLTAEVRSAPAGRWAKRLLKHGALVAMQLRLDGRRLVRIAREERPANPHAMQRWESELQTFEKHLGIVGWVREPDPDALGIAVRYLELWSGETAPGKARCMDCPAEIPFDRVFGGRDRCQACALTAGRTGP